MIIAMARRFISMNDGCQKRSYTIINNSSIPLHIFPKLAEVCKAKSYKTANIIYVNFTQKFDFVFLIFFFNNQLNMELI